MEREPAAQQIMTEPCIVCRDDASLDEVVMILADREISGLPVIDWRGIIVGVISERDLSRLVGMPLVQLAARGFRATGPWLRHVESTRTVHARDIMSTPPMMVRPETPLHALAEMMVKRGVNRLPVAIHGRVMGMVTRGDILRAIAGLSSKVVAPAPAASSTVADQC